MLLLPARIIAPGNVALVLSPPRTRSLPGAFFLFGQLLATATQLVETQRRRVRRETQLDWWICKLRVAVNT